MHYRLFVLLVLQKIISGFIFFLSMVSIKPCLAQGMTHTYVPFVSEGKKWCYVLYDPYDPYARNSLVFTMRSDTLVSGKTYKKVYCRNEKLLEKDEKYYCAVREESEHVYIVELDDNVETLLYDFSQQNEVVKVTWQDYTFARLGGYGLNTYQHDPTMIWEYPLYELSGDEVLQTHSLGFWIEGVGNVYGNSFAKELYGEKANNPTGYVESCMDGDKCVFNIGWLAEPSSLKQLKMDTQFTVTNLFDLQGRRLKGEPKRGLYIKDGKKVVK